jgi:hypothetical protein
MMCSVYTAYTHLGLAELHDDDAPLVVAPAAFPAAFSLDMKFDASDRYEAKKWLLQRFSSAHGGRCVCRNSTEVYLYCKCINCEASCAAAYCSTRQWRVSVMKSGANSPCVPPHPHPHPHPHPLPTTKAINVRSDVPVAVPVIELPKCVLCGDLCETSVTCSKGHVIGVSCEANCFETYVLSFISGESLMTFIEIGCIIRCPECYTPAFARATTPLDMQTEGSKLSKDGFAKYVKALAEPGVMAAVRAALQEAQAQMPALDHVSTTLAAIFQPERCPTCDTAFEHHGGCTSMPCPSCKTIFCLWCRAAFKTSGEGHHHAWNCQKAPSNDEMLTVSRVFPAGQDADLAGEFLHAYFKVRKLEMLQFQLQQGSC